MHGRLAAALRRSKRRRSSFPASPCLLHARGRRLDRHLSRAQHRHRLEGCARGGAGEPRPRRAPSRRAAGALATPHQVHGTEAVVVDDGLGAGPRAEGGRRRHRPAGHRRRRRRGRLRAGALRRCRGAGRRRRACRLEGRAHRHSGIDASRRWRSSARTRGEHRRRARPDDLSDAYEVGPEFVGPLRRADAGERALLPPSAREGHAMFDLPAYIVARLEAAGVGARRDSASAPMPTRRASIPTAAPRIAASRTTAACSRRSC